MKRISIIALLSSLLNIAFGQIKNGDFELTNDSFPTLPKDWNVKKISGFNFHIDKEIKYAGTSSFFINSTQNSDSNTFIPFSQTLDFNVKSFKKVALTVYIKTENVTGNVGLWCQIRDKDGKMIGFQNLEIQKTKIIGTNDWKKYSLLLYVDTKCKKLYPGGYLQGKGSVWFDNFSIENLEFSSVPATKDAQKYIDNFLRIVKKNSIYSNSIDWKTLYNEIELLSMGTDLTSAAVFVPPHVLSKLREVGDNHSFIQSKATFSKATKINLDERRPYGKLLENNIGYVYVPGFASSNDTVSKNFAKSIQNIIKDLDTKNNISGWIVDLRENTGGNMYPMIAGLGPIIGEGTLGYFYNADGKGFHKWLYSNGSTKVTKVKEPYTLKNPNGKVAVLISGQTSSSGEMTLISFIGRPNTKLFGQPSGGFTTGNSMFKLKDGTALALATSYVSDRNKQKYLGAINPDVLLAKNSDILKTAADWINEK